MEQVSERRLSEFLLQKLETAAAAAFNVSPCTALSFEANGSSCECKSPATGRFIARKSL